MALRLTGAGEKAVFLLGAGCSMQYGLPSFYQLLTCLATELRVRRHSSPGRLDDIRAAVERRWLLGTTADFRRQMIARYLGGVSGAECPAYRQLARLARDGRVKAFINMNFDLLLEEALSEEGVRYKTANTFSRNRAGELIVYKLHGSIGKLDAVSGEEDVILDLAKSDLFAEKERSAAGTLLASSDVVILGYSGVDLKLPGALMPKRTKGNKKVFLVNVSDPDVHLLHAAEQRDPGYILVTGTAASFENLMESLAREMMDPAGREPAPEPEPPRVKEFDLMTRAEEAAFTRCLEAAVSMRAGMNVAEASPVGLLDHAQEVFRICMDLATATGVRLSGPEKHLLRCASVLHDLGYFFAFCGGRATENPGWLLLNRHGRMTIDLIQERFAEEPTLPDALIPESYDAGSRKDLLEHLLGICRFHAALQIPARAVASNTLVVKIDGVPVKSRFHLLQALFAAAENIAREHPFLPSSEPATSGAEGRQWAIDDPVLDLYLRRKKGTVSFSIERGEVRAEISPEAAGSKATLWLLVMTSEFIKVLDRVVRADGHEGGIALQASGETLPVFKGSPGTFLKELLGDALEEALEDSIQALGPGAVEEVPCLLDLVMIYGKCFYRPEPRVPLKSKVITRTLGRIERRGEAPHRGVLHLYLKINGKARPTRMEQVFLDTFERLLYPGWRFLARNWSEGIEATLTARASLDLGSSRFRNEVMGGLKHLLREKVLWKGPEAFGHDGCTLCTARLLYIFTSARQLFPPAEFARVALDRRRRSLNDAVRGMLLHFRFRSPDDPAWSGVTAEEEQEERIHSPDYAAWAAWALAYCLEVDNEIRTRTGEEWLSETCGFQAGEVRRLAQERWNLLLGVTAKQLLSDRVEEPHSFTIGQFTSSFLNLHKLSPEVRELLGSSTASLHRLAKEVETAYTSLTRRPLAQLSMFYLWPATMFLDSVFPSADKEDSLVHTCHEYLRSPLWIKRGPNTGSWGFNVKNTSTLLTTLTTFWRYAFDDEKNRERFEDAFARYPAGKKVPKNTA